jgi:hypothetical protein
MSVSTCPKCQRAMEEGFLLDKGHMNVASTAEWLEGAPESSFWTGLKTRDRERLSVRTFRCTGCGYLESYARGN